MNLAMQTCLGVGEDEQVPESCQRLCGDVGTTAICGDEDGGYLTEAAGGGARVDGHGGRRGEGAEARGSGSGSKRCGHD